MAVCDRGKGTEVGEKEHVSGSMVGWEDNFPAFYIYSCLYS